MRLLSDINDKLDKLDEILHVLHKTKAETRDGSLTYKETCDKITKAYTEFKTLQRIATNIKKLVKLASVRN